MIKSYQAPLRTTPHKKIYHQKYDIDYVRSEAKNNWERIWDDLGIPIDCLKGRCPLCKHAGVFQIIDISTGTFYCTHCKARGDGILLLQHYYRQDQEETVERLGRNLRLRHKAAIYE